MYDTVSQYGQVLSGNVDDWHPPVMVRLWQLLNPLASGTAAMFVLQAALYAGGFGLVIAALAKNGRRRAGAAAALLALTPLLLGWQMVVLKDAQMLGALVAALGIAAHYRLSQRKIPLAAAAVVVALMAYATLVRANAVFATVPLAVLLYSRHMPTLFRGGLAAAAIVLVLGLSPLINQRLLGASPSGAAKSQPIFDLAAIAVATPRSPSPFTPAEVEQISARHCAKDFFWDPLGDPTACGSVTERVKAQDEAHLYAELARSAALHPLAYAEHRLRHWNSTERWLVASNLPDAAPPIEAEPNDLGLATPANPVAASWQDVAALEAATPLGWPIVWTVIALSLLPAAWRGRADASAGLALALLASSLMLELSFLAISIASDLRYHLWPMIASALALILLSDDLPLKRAEWIAGSTSLALIISGGLFTRSSLPPAPDTYEAMIHAPSG